MRTVRSVDELRAAVDAGEPGFLVCAGQAVVVLPPSGRSRRLTAIGVEQEAGEWRWSYGTFRRKELEGERFFAVLASGWLALAREASKTGGGCC